MIKNGKLTYWSNDIGNVRNCRSTGGSEIEHFGAWFHVNIVQATHDCGGQFATEWIPYAIFNFAVFVLKRKSCRILRISGVIKGRVSGSRILWSPGFYGRTLGSMALGS